MNGAYLRAVKMQKLVLGARRKDILPTGNLEEVVEDPNPTPVEQSKPWKDWIIHLREFNMSMDSANLFLSEAEREQEGSPERGSYLTIAYGFSENALLCLKRLEESVPGMNKEGDSYTYRTMEQKVARFRNMYQEVLDGPSVTGTRRALKAAIASKWYEKVDELRAELDRAQQKYRGRRV